MNDQSSEVAHAGLSEKYHVHVAGNEAPASSDLAGPVTQEEFEHSARLAQRFTKQLDAAPINARIDPFLRDLDTPVYLGAGLPREQGTPSASQAFTAGINPASPLSGGGHGSHGQDFVPPVTREQISLVDQFQRAQVGASSSNNDSSAAHNTHQVLSGGFKTESQKAIGDQNSGAKEGRNANEQSSKVPGIGGIQPSGGSNDPDNDADHDSGDDGKKGTKNKRAPPKKKKEGVICIAYAWSDKDFDSCDCQKRFDGIKPLCDHAVDDHGFKLVYTKNLKYIVGPLRDGTGDDHRSFCLACRLPFDRFVDLKKHITGHGKAVMDKHNSIVLTHAILVDLLVRRRSASQVTKDYNLDIDSNVATADVKASAKRHIVREPAVTASATAPVKTSVQSADEEGNVSDTTEVTVTTATGKSSFKRRNSFSRPDDLATKKQRTPFSTAKLRLTSSEIPASQERQSASRMPSLTQSGITLQSSEPHEDAVDPALERLSKKAVQENALPLSHRATGRDDVLYSNSNNAATAEAHIPSTAQFTGYTHPKHVIDSLDTGVKADTSFVEAGYTQDIVSQDSIRGTFLPNGMVLAKDLKGRGLIVDKVEGGGLLLRTPRVDGA